MRKCNNLLLLLSCFVCYLICFVLSSAEIRRGRTVCLRQGLAAERQQVGNSVPQVGPQGQSHPCCCRHPLRVLMRAYACRADGRTVQLESECVRSE